MKNCFEESTLQAFLDNELPSATANRVTRHLGECEACAALFADVESATAQVFEALDADLGGLVPTHRLWEKINASIESENRRRSPFARLLQPFFGLFRGFSGPSIVAFASLLFVFAAFGVLSAVKRESGAGFSTTAAARPGAPFRFEPPPVRSGFTTEPAGDRIEPSGAGSRPGPRRADDRRTRGFQAVNLSYDYVEGEETYVKTIAGLERSVTGTKDEVLSPSARFTYERDMAVVDDAIRRMRREVRRDPRNANARAVLLQSYQNKIDLLNSVNDRGELMASLER